MKGRDDKAFVLPVLFAQRICYRRTSMGFNDTCFFLICSVQLLLRLDGYRVYRDRSYTPKHWIYILSFLL